ncbi:MAG: SUMF1/EgtB/PvdO family nonheme iron enzyme [Prevotella sp.]|nr:SUMF1/EgtB/PvdO family nonheme iron enzyme [Prevotella sp.]MBS7207396.1 SUMF1/EgtB/PvdO family nonheme iron enzyme [Prevotella sp.]
MEQWDDVLPVGSVLRSGKREYRVEAVLGKGGFGITYKVSAMEQVGQIPVRVEFAMKEFFMDGCLRDASGKVSTAATKGEAADGLKDFISEARRLNSLCGQCRNIVPVDEVFEANGTACYVMEFLDGGSLADYVKKQGALSVGAAKKILKPVADAVAFLHCNRITHLDIKPGNIMFRSNGDPVLIDFGLAKHYDRRGNATTTVRTLAYSAGFSPAEQYVGLKQFSPQSDVYALAATFANMLTGKTPPEAIDLEFSLNDWSVCLPEEVRPAVVHAMAYSRKDRTLSVCDFVKELYGNDPSVVEKPVSQPAAEPPVESKTEVIGEGKKSTKKWWIIAACVAVAAVVGIVCAKFLSVGEDMEQKTEQKTESAPQLVAVEGSQTFTVNGAKFTMVPVEGGTFTMGATSEQGSDAWDEEKPAHKVTLSDYYIGQTEVTQALWKAVMGSNPSDSKGDNLPVEQVSWDDCQVFIQNLNQLTGKQFRLPTEAEWEYAARGGRKSRGYKYAGGNDIGLVAWYEDNSGNETHPVATKQANELGIYDMSGNVWEWCSDRYGDYQSSSQSDPQGPSSDSIRVGRGGSCYRNARLCRVSFRYGSFLDCRFIILGLRLSCKK